MRPIPIRKKEATISLPNLLTPLVIRFIFHPYPALPLEGEGIVFLSRGAAPLLNSHSVLMSLRAEGVAISSSPPATVEILHFVQDDTINNVPIFDF